MAITSVQTIIQSFFIPSDNKVYNCLKSIELDDMGGVIPLIILLIVLHFFIPVSLFQTTAIQRVMIGISEFTLSDVFT